MNHQSNHHHTPEHHHEKVTVKNKIMTNSAYFGHSLNVICIKNFKIAHIDWFPIAVKAGIFRVLYKTKSQLNNTFHELQLNKATPKIFK